MPHSFIAGGIPPNHQQRRRLFLGKQALRNGLAPAVKRSVLRCAARSSLYPAHARSGARQAGAAVGFNRPRMRQRQRKSHPVPAAAATAAAAAAAAAASSARQLA
jgi:hypothetical protein